MLLGIVIGLVLYPVLRTIIGWVMDKIPGAHTAD